MALKVKLYQLSLRIVPPLYAMISRLVFSTCRVKEFGRHNFDKCHQDGLFIMAIWHYSLFYSIYRAGDLDCVAMVSASSDAEYISQLLRRMDVATVRGSRGKGGLQAIQEMKGLMSAEKRNAAIVVDGSQGPPRKAQAGAVFLASKTGAPILPVAWAAKSYKAFHSWDRTVFPLPFSKLALCYGEPIHVPEKIKSTDLEGYRLKLENSLNNQYYQAWQCFGHPNHDGGLTQGETGL